MTKLEPLDEPLKGVHTSNPGPKFDPVTASNDELKANYLPPRPDARATPTAFANWQRALGTKPHYAPSNPAKLAGADEDKIFVVTHPNDGRTQGSSGNWSGGYVRPSNDDD